MKNRTDSMSCVDSPGRTCRNITSLTDAAVLLSLRGFLWKLSLAWLFISIANEQRVFILLVQSSRRMDVGGKNAKRVSLHDKNNNPQLPSRRSSRRMRDDGVQIARYNNRKAGDGGDGGGTARHGCEAHY